MIGQGAGRVEIKAYTDGSPISIVLYVTANNGERVEVRVWEDVLHDLRYCIDRVLAQIDQRS
jgi:hypothetical protein